MQEEVERVRLQAAEEQQQLQRDCDSQVGALVQHVESVKLDFQSRLKEFSDTCKVDR